MRLENAIRRAEGMWAFIGDNMFQCTSCAEVYSMDQFKWMRNRTSDSPFPKFCPNCGARMLPKQRASGTHFDLIIIDYSMADCEKGESDE